MMLAGQLSSDEGPICTPQHANRTSTDAQATETGSDDLVKGPSINPT